MLIDSIRLNVYVGATRNNHITHAKNRVNKDSSGHKTLILLSI